MGLERRTERTIPNPRSDGVTKNTEKEARERSIVSNAKILSFKTMAISLLHDVIAREFDTTGRRLVQPDDAKAPAPLAKIVAEEHLSKLGILPNVVLELAGVDEVIGLNPEFQFLSPEEIEARRAVIGYRWNESAPLHYSLKSTLHENLIALEDQATISEEAILNENHALVISAVWKNRDVGMSYDDLEAIARFALTRVIPKFDWRRGYPFGAYAMRTMTGTILRTLRDTGHLISRPRSVWDNDPKVTKARAALEVDNVEVTSAKLAEKSGLTVDEVEEVLHHRRLRVTSLNQQVRGYETPTELGSTLSGPNDEERIITSLMIDSILARLSERDREIIVRRILGQQQDHIAAAVGISQMHVSRRLRTIREMIEKDLHGSEEGNEISGSQLRRIREDEFKSVLNYPNLSERDRRIALMIRTGMTTTAIAQRVNMSEKSVLKVEQYLLDLYREVAKANKSTDVSIRTYDL